MAPAGGAAEDTGKFFIEAYDVLGNTLLDQQTIESAVYPYLGPDRTIDDVNKARESLEKAYRDRGFQAASVSVLGTVENDTVVQFQVQELKLGKVEVTGNKHFSSESIKKQVPALVPGESPNLTLAQAEMARLDRNADRRVTPRLSLGQEPGTIDVNLEVEDNWPYHASVTVSNDHSPNTSELRVLSQVRATNLWGLGHNFSFSYLVAPQRRDDAEVFAGSYLAPIWNSPWSLLVYGYKSNSNVALLGGSNVLGDGYSIGARALLSLPNAGKNWSQSVNFGFDYKDFKETTFIENADPSPAPIRYLPFVASYSAQRVGDRSTLQATFGLTAGVRTFSEEITVIQPGTGPINEPIFGNRRFGARENFVHVNVDGEWNRTLTDDTKVVGRMSAQLADGPLISNEQFSIGGMTSVRGYLQSEAVGDDGVSGQFEVQLPTLLGGKLKQVQELRPYFFVDAGFTRSRRLADPSQDNDFTLVGIGGGLKAQLFKFLSGDVIVAAPLLEGIYTGIGGPNIFFSVKGEF